jgi:hypothetical protein
MFQQAIADLMRDTIHHTPAAGYTGSGMPIFVEGSEVAHRARVARKQRTVVSKSGSIAVSQSQVWIAGLVVLDFSDRIRLPDGSTPPILAFEHLPDDEGTAYTKVYC